MKDGAELHLLEDGTVWQDPGGPFGLVPRDLWAKSMPPEAQELIPMVLRSLLIRSQGKTILVETGLGSKLDEAALATWGLERLHGTLLDGLARIGVAPEEIDLVINTHLHADHCSGNTSLLEGELVPTFPRAEYLVQRLEWVGASFPDERTRNTYLAMNFLPLVKSGRMRLLHGDTEVTREVRCVVTRGHTRGHQSVMVEAGFSSVLFTGDMTSLTPHFAHLNWLTAYDVEPLENIQTKRRWQAWAVANEALVISAHDKYQPIVKAFREDRRLRLEEARLPTS